jgi:flagellar basal body-associated protein FliL
VNRQNVLFISLCLLITLILGVLVASFVWNPEGGNEIQSSENANSVEYQSAISQNTLSQPAETNESQKISPSDPYKEFKE